LSSVVVCVDSTATARGAERIALVVLTGREKTETEPAPSASMEKVDDATSSVEDPHSGKAR
jgi:hypothetical protein